MNNTNMNSKNPQKTEDVSRVTVLETEITTMKKELESQETLHKETNRQLQDRISALERKYEEMIKETEKKNNIKTIEKKHEEMIKSFEKKHDKKIKAIEKKHEEDMKKYAAELKHLKQTKQPLEPTTSTPDPTDAQDIDFGVLSKEEKKRNWNFDELRKLINGTEPKFLALLKLNENLVVLRSPNDRKTLLHHASKHGSKNCTEQLLKAGLDPLLKDKSGNMAIHDAAEHGKTGVIEILLKENPSMLNETGCHGQTPLHFAAKHNKENVVKHLMSLGDIDVKIRDNDDKRADEYDITDNHIKQLIKRKGGKQKKFF